MPLVKADLALAINDAIAATDKDGNPIAVTSQMEAYADAIITTLTAGLVNHAIPGSVLGVTSPGSPLSNGSALAGLLTALIPATWSGVMQAAIPDATSLSQEASASTGYLMSSALVNFAAGNIKGTCTNTPVAPGPLANGEGADGEISGIAGAAWASAVMPPTGDPTLTQAIYNAICDYVTSNAAATYAAGTVQGVCPPGGGPLSAGVALAGTLA